MVSEEFILNESTNRLQDSLENIKNLQSFAEKNITCVKGLTYIFFAQKYLLTLK